MNSLGPLIRILPRAPNFKYPPMVPRLQIFETRLDQDFKFAFCMAAFMSGSSHMHAARSFRSYIQAYNCEKAVGSGPDIQGGARLY